MHKIKLQNAQGLLDSMTYGSSRGWIKIERSDLEVKTGVFGVQGTLLIRTIEPWQLDNIASSTKSVLDLMTRVVNPQMVDRLHTLKIFEVETELAKISLSKVAPEVLHAMRSQTLASAEITNGSS